MQLLRSKFGLFRNGAALLAAATVVVVVATLLGTQPAKSAALATSYQMPCSPYGGPYYEFGQWVSGWGYHTGQDVCKAASMPVYATSNGTVVYSARTPDSYRWGNLIMIEHKNGDGSTVVSLYGHLADNRAVGAGQSVVKGQLIGWTGPSYSGANGNWGAHLHFGIHAGGYGAAIGTYASWVHGYETGGVGAWVNPTSYINARLADYDYIPVSSNSPTLNWNGSSEITFQVRNTGARTWSAGGANPMRLGTIAPQDHVDGFSGGYSGNGSNAGWAAGGTRIKMVADTPPGGTATFTATFTSNHLPRLWNDCFGMVIEGVAWMPGTPVCTNVTIQPPSYRAQYVAQMITSDLDPANLTHPVDAQYLKPGQKVSLKFMLKNVGELDWEAGGDNPVRLGTSNPYDRPSAFATGGDGSIPSNENWPAYNRPSALDGKYDAATKTVSSADRIAPGETGIFSFTATAPQTPGTYNEYFNPLAEGAQWMPNLGTHLPLRVVAPGYHYDVASQNFTTKSAGTTTTNVDAVLQIKNAGREAWPVNGNLRLGTDDPMDQPSAFYTAAGSGAWLSPNRLSAIDRNVTNPAKSTVEPGETAEFTMKLAVPGNVPVGSYPVHVRPLVEGVTWLPEDYGTNFTINVTTPPYDYQYVRQTFSGDPANVARGGALTTNLAVKNTGRTPWPVGGPNPVRLGTSRPNDRASTLATTGGNDPWLSASRPSAIDGRVIDTTTLATVPATQINPGETALFKLPLDTTDPLGTYNEYVNLVAEGITWLPDYGIYFPITLKDSPSAWPTPGPGSSPTPSPTPPGTSPTPTPSPIISWVATGDQYTSCKVIGSSTPCAKDTVAHRVSASWNYQTTYTTTALSAGTYNLTLGYQNVSGSLPAGYAYNVKLRINGGTAIPLNLDGTKNTYTISNLALSGASTLSLEWTNDYYDGTNDANLAINSLSLGT